MDESKIEKKSIIDRLREYFAKCEIFNKESPFYTDFNSEEPGNYSLNAMPSPKPEKDILGNRIYIYNFAITSKAYTTSDLERIQNLGLCEKVQKWVEDKDDIQDYPELGENIEVTEIGVTNSGFLFENDEKSDIGLYQIQLQMLYTEYKKIKGGMKKWQ